MEKLLGNNLYSVRDMAQLLKCSPYTVRLKIRKGELKSRKLGVEYYSTEEELKEFLNLPLQA